MKFKENLDGVDIIKKSSDALIFDKSAFNVLAELDQTREDFWNLDNTSANFLSLLIKIKDAKNALEIGTSNGYSGIWLANALKTTGGRLTTIEFWDNRLNVAIENFKKAGVDDIIETRLGQAVMILEEMFMELYPGRNINDKEFSDPTQNSTQKGRIKPEGELFDFVFIDANKSEYIKYFKLIHPMLQRGGMIVADNILSHYKKVEPYVKAVTTHPNYQTQLIPIDTGMMISLKI